jgi:hypothetical protein
MGLFNSLFGSGNKSAYDTSGLSSAVNTSNQQYQNVYDQAIAGGQTWLDLGTAGANQLGSQMDALTTPFSYNSFTADPSYQFLQDEASKAVERSAAAKGSLYAPSTAKALQDRATSLASTEYNNAFNRNLAQNQSTYDMLMGISNVGQNQAATNAQYGWNLADSQSNNNIGLQNAILGAAQSKNAAQTSGWGNLLSTGLNVASLFSDRRVKHNIKHIGSRKGYPWYEFSYIGSNRRYRGVMAQDVMQSRPDAVSSTDGVLMVDYGKLGLTMEEV